MPDYFRVLRSSTGQLGICLGIFGGLVCVSCLVRLRRKYGEAVATI